LKTEENTNVVLKNKKIKKKKFLILVSSNLSFVVGEELWK